MKTITTLLILSLTATFIFSCSKAESLDIDPAEGIVNTITVAAPGGEADTKVSFGITGTGVKPSWEEGDVITIYDESGDTRIGNFYCIAVDPNTEDATFKAEQYVPSLSLNTTYQAVHPASTRDDIDTRDSERDDNIKQNQQLDVDSPLSKHLYMKSEFTIDNNGSTNIVFDYEVAMYKLTFPWSHSTAPDKIKIQDGSQGHLISRSPGFLISSKKGTAWFMIKPNTGGAEREISFTVYKNNYRSERFTVTTTKSFYAGKVYQATITEYNATPYVEDDVFRGFGVTIDGVMWAPVNLGYQKYREVNFSHRGYPWGKLYQWGRLDGQGYKDDTFEDEEYPQSPTTLLGAAPYADDNILANTFYKGDAGTGFIWMDTNDGYPAFTGLVDWTDLSTATYPSGVGNPCPEGWTVPTYAQLTSLIQNSENKYSSYNWNGPNRENQSGYTFRGSDPDGPGVFFPASGMRSTDDGVAFGRNEWGEYWANENVDSELDIDRTRSYVLLFNENTVTMDPNSDFSQYSDYRVYKGEEKGRGASVRCVKE